MSNAENKIPVVCPSVYNPIVANPEFEETGERTAESLAAAPFGLQGALDCGKHAQCLL